MGARLRDLDEAAVQVSDHEADEMYALAADLRARVEAWIGQTRPELLP
jgi:hypothetical protein